MDLSLNETQQLIQDSTKDFVKGACDRDVLLKLDRAPEEIMPRYWKQFSQMGWTGMAIPEVFGGSGNAMTDVAVLFEELGTGPVPGPLFSSVVLCARLILDVGTEAQKKTLLPKIASGECVFALALTEAQYSWSSSAIQMKSVKDRSYHILSGAKLFVDDAEFATDLLVVARGDTGIGLYHVNAKANGISVRSLSGFMNAKSEVLFDSVRAELIGAEKDTWESIEKSIASSLPVLCAYKVGGCKRVFDMSLSYAGERKQFGQVIGRFPRVQDHLINLVNHLDSARWTTYEALWKVDGGIKNASVSCHVAKAVSSESYLRATDFAHEVHAGIGVVREYGLTLHTKMSRSLYHSLGAPREHHHSLAQALKFAV